MTSPTSTKIIKGLFLGMGDGGIGVITSGDVACGVVAGSMNRVFQEGKRMSSV